MVKCVLFNMTFAPHHQIGYAHFSVQSNCLIGLCIDPKNIFFRPMGLLDIGWFEIAFLIILNELTV
jgi:hypothetical protein